MLKRILSLAVALLLMAGLSAALAADAGEYRVEVDVTNQITTVYRASDRTIVRQMICSTGTGTKTPIGTFRLEPPRPGSDREPWYYIGKYGCYVKYATRIRGSILFHSIPYADKEMSAIDKEALAQLGTKASHGCIRLRWEDAEWIAENCPEGTVVRIYNGASRREALRQALLDEGYVQDGGLTYDEFLAASPNGEAFSIGRGAQGDEVSALQRQLVGLGFMDGDVTGTYDDATVLAVMRYQSACALTVNGVASGALTDRIMSEEDAVAEYATLTPGCSGTLVARFQRALQGLGFYQGGIDGEYGDALADATAAFCGCMGLEAGDITPALRDAAYRLLDELKGSFGEDGFLLAYTGAGTVGRVRRDSPLYAAPDGASAPLTLLPAGERVRLVGRRGRWRAVEYGGWRGYIPAGRLDSISEAGPSAHWGRSIDELGEVEMHPGDLGDGVFALNRRLAELGYYTGENSSLYSLATAQAVADFQQANGLEITQTASPELQRAIASGSLPAAGTAEEDLSPAIEGCDAPMEEAGDGPVEITIEDDPPRPAWMRPRPAGL